MTEGIIQAKKLGSQHIASGAIISDLIAISAVGTQHLAASAVTSAKIASGQVGIPHIYPGAVTSAKIGALAVGTPHIAALAIVSGKVASGGLSPLSSGKVWAGYTGNIPREENKPSAGLTIATGSYAGDNSDGRQITTGFKCSMVIVVQRGNYPHRVIMVPSSTVFDDENSDNINCVARQYLHAADGFVVGKTTDFMNDNGQTYDYWAISE